MKSLRPILTLAILLQILVSCATGPRFSALEPIPQNSSQIYIVRDSKFFGVAMVFNIFIDGARVGSLTNGSYISHVISPGPHRLNAQTSLIVSTADKATFVQVPVDGRVFVRVELRQSTPTSWTYNFNQIPEAEAMTLLPNLSLSSSKAKSQ